MTTEAAARRYLAEHLREFADKKYAIYNPHGKPIEDLPVIYGFNNGGNPGMYEACLLSEDGTFLGNHLCSAEGYMPFDLGVSEGSRPDRHETFRKHYPDGYRMDFIPLKDAPTHAELDVAYQRNQALRAKARGEELP